MKPPCRPVVFAAALCLAASSTIFGPAPALLMDSVAASEPAAQAAQRSPTDSRRFDQIKTLLRRGAYDEALEAIEALLAAHPDDPLAQLYQRVCQQRLQASGPFAQLSADQFGALQRQLQQEAKQQQRSAAIQRAMERQVEREQLKWERNLEAREKEAQRQAQRQLRQEHVAAAAERAKAKALEQEQAVQRATAPAPPSPQEAPSPAREADGPGGPEAPPPPAEAAEEAGDAGQAPPPRAVSGPAVELAPVTVPSQPTSPSLVGRTLPIKGAVQINARQMSVSPDQRIAIADGDVEVVFDNALLTCDHLTLFTDTKDAYAEGRVRIEEGQQVFRGEIAHYNFETKKGRFLQGTVSSPPWHQHGRAVEHIAEGVYEVTPGYLTTCELEPPHFRLAGRRATVFAGEKLARASNVAFFVEQLPFLYLPYLSFADRKSPFFIIPGKKKPWGPFALMGYRYALPGPANQQGTIHLDWRTNFGWGQGVDYQFDSPQTGKGLFKVYYNQDADRTKLEDELVKGADKKRYRALWRHRWNPMPDTTVVTDIQKYSDFAYRREFLFREEFVDDDVPESFVSMVTNDPNYTFSGLVKKRINRFQTVDNTLPQLTFDVRSQQIGDTWLFSETKFDVANFETKRAHSDNDTDAVRVDWFQLFRYAVNWFRPLEVTPKFGLRQTYYNKDRQGSDREGDRNVFSGQWNTGVETSLKLFRIFPVRSNLLGLNLHQLRHVLTPTVAYDFIHRPTVANDLLSFASAGSATNRVTFGVENKLQTRRPDDQGKLRSVDLGRLLVSLPYNFKGPGNKQGGRLGDWSTDLELYPTPWMRLETDWTYQSIETPGELTNTSRYNLDLVVVGGRKGAEAKYAPGIQAPGLRGVELGATEGLTHLLPQGEWYLGLGHRYSRSDKTEDVLQWDWQLSNKWQIGTYHRFTWKEVASGAKRFNNLREYQYRLRRDLHDWIGELVWRVDREYGEELYLTFTLKAYPEMPFGLSEAYHQPKLGSQSSPFSPLHAN